MDHKREDGTPTTSKGSWEWVDNNNNLLLVVDGFRCKRCDGTIPEANIAENLVVDGEMYGCVKIMCFVLEHC